MAAMHDARKQIVKDSTDATYAKQSAKSFKCPVCGAGSGEDCKS